MIEIIDIENDLKKIITNYKKIYNFIFLYKDELITILDDQNTINLLNQNINNNHIDSIIQNITKNLPKVTNINLKYYISIYNDINALKQILQENINYIHNIDIFEKKYLISDTSKNNINQNKTLIIDLYNKLYSENNILISDCNQNIFNNLDIVHNYNDIFLTIKQYIDSNDNTIYIYLEFLNNIKNIENLNIRIYSVYYQFTDLTLKIMHYF